MYLTNKKLLDIPIFSVFDRSDDAIEHGKISDNIQIVAALTLKAPNYK